MLGMDRRVLCVVGFWKLDAWIATIAGWFTSIGELCRTHVAVYMSVKLPKAMRSSSHKCPPGQLICIISKTRVLQNTWIDSHTRSGKPTSRVITIPPYRCCSSKSIMPSMRDTMVLSNPKNGQSDPQHWALLIEICRVRKKRFSPKLSILLQDTWSS
jgi:hypothetical protein